MQIQVQVVKGQRLYSVFMAEVKIWAKECPCVQVTFIASTLQAYNILTHTWVNLF